MPKYKIMVMNIVKFKTSNMKFIYKYMVRMGMVVEEFGSNINTRQYTVHWKNRQALRFKFLSGYCSWLHVTRTNPMYFKLWGVLKESQYLRHKCNFCRLLNL